MHGSLVANSERFEYGFLSVRGMDRNELLNYRRKVLPLICGLLTVWVAGEIYIGFVPLL